MDTITQGLLGAVTAQLGFRQSIGRDATLVATASAILPDLDVFLAPFITLSGAELDGFAVAASHRGITHSIIFAPLLALPVTLLWWWLRRSLGNQGNHATKRHSSPWMLYLCVLVAVATHGLLDWCTSYGTQLLSPITARRYAIDAVPIVDFIYTPLLIVTLLACGIARRVNRSRQVRRTLIIGWIGFLSSVAYLAAGRVMHNWAAEQARMAADQAKMTVIRADAYPALGTIFLWRTVVETEQEWIVARLHRFSGDRANEWRRQIARKNNGPWVARARQVGQVKNYDWFADGRLRASYASQGDHHIVTFHDMRYGWPVESVESLWPLTVILNDEGKVLHVGRKPRNPRPSPRRMVKDIWHDIWNP